MLVGVVIGLVRIYKEGRLHFSSPITGLRSADAGGVCGLTGCRSDFIGDFKRLPLYSICIYSNMFAIKLSAYYQYVIN